MALDLDCSCVAMAWNYVKISMFGTAATYSRDDEIMAAVAVLTQTPQKAPLGRFDARPQDLQA